jgi:hypothetical protein
VIGLLAGLVRAWLAKRSYELPPVRRVELALVAFLPQGIAFFVPQTSHSFSQWWASFILPVSMVVLVFFAWINRRLQGFWLLGVGLLLNLAVITANGGLMPIRPETLNKISGTQSEWAVGSRPPGSKGIVLPKEQTRLEWLADRYTPPAWLPIRFAYSLGDLFLAAGAFVLLWSGGAMRHLSKDGLIEGQLNSSQNPRSV